MGSEMCIRDRNHFDKSKAGHKVTMICGNAQNTIKELNRTFDLVYLDGDKLRYSFYFEQVMPLLNFGGLIIADNVLWDGTVLDPEDKKAEAIAAFNKLVAEDKRVEQVLLPVRDGVNVIRKK